MEAETAHRFNFPDENICWKSAFQQGICMFLCLPFVSVHSSLLPKRGLQNIHLYFQVAFPLLGNVYTVVARVDGGKL